MLYLTSNYFKLTTTAKHITFLCSRLDLPGGIERAIVNTANLFIQKGHLVTLLILDETDKTFYHLNPAIKILCEPLSFGISTDGSIVSRKIKLLSDVLKLRKLLKSLKPQLLITTEYPFAATAILSGAKKYSKVVSWEHHHYYELKRNMFWENIFKMTYPRLHSIICLNEDEKNIFARLNMHTVVIPNFVATSAKADETRNKILTVARLTYVKGIDLLLPVAKSILSKHSDWQWKIIGSGEMQDQVNRFIQNERLQNKLLLQTPVDDNILSEYQQASLYVMTSRNECFPMTLLEAQSTGLPCIAYDCETGPRHIINHNVDGLLVEKENIDKMIAAIEALINNEERRNKMAENACENGKRFSPDKIYGLWKDKIFI